MEKKPSKPKDFVERQWDDYTEGDYDENGFFVTPNGSFWDPDGVYFNKDGFDKHGAYYDDNNEYVPGEGWDEANNCYLDEINDYYDDDEYGSDHDEEEDDGFGDIDINNIHLIINGGITKLPVSSGIFSYFNFIYPISMDNIVINRKM